MKKPLVSIITPCLNSEKYISKLLNSVLMQNYRPIELIIVNDGSTDGTLEILEDYKPKFARAGITFTLITQKNNGVFSAVNAINTGLRKFSGDYLTQIDSDDYLAQEYSIEKKVEFLERNKQFDAVYSAVNVVDAKDYGNIIDIRKENYCPPREDLFLSSILEMNYIWVPVAYLIRSKAFLKANPDRHILEDAPGQNIQMRLPMYYHSKVGYIDEVLGTVVAHDDSHSRRVMDIDETIKYQNGVKTTYIDTINKIDMPKHERDCYIQIINNKYDALFQRLENQRLNSMFTEIRNSKSWKITKPLRYISRLLKGDV